MNKRKIFYRIMSIILIVVTLLTSQSESILAATSKNPKNQSGKRLSDGKKPKDQPIGKELKTKKPSKIPYGILKNEDKLEKWKNKKELIEERTGNSKTYLNDDRTKTTLMFFEPIHVKSGKDASKNEKYREKAIP